MNTKSILIDPLRLSFLIEGRKDMKGNDYFVFTFGTFRIKLTSMDSILDLIKNNSVGYVDSK